MMAEIKLGRERREYYEKVGKATRPCGGEDWFTFVRLSKGLLLYCVCARRVMMLCRAFV
jgi:hypothetical protein